MYSKISLTSSTLLYTFTGFTVKGISFLLLPFYSHFFTTAEFGTLSLMMGISIIGTVFFQLGLPTVFPKFYLDLKEKSTEAHIFSAIFYRFLVWGSLLYSVFYLLSGSISYWVHGTDSYEMYYQILFLVVCFDTFGMIIIQYFRTEQQSGAAAFLQLVATVVNVAVLIILLLNGHNNILSFVIAHLSAALTVLPIGVFMLRSKFTRYLPEINVSLILKFAVPVVIGALFSTLLDVADRFILLLFLDEGEVGIYSFMYRIALGLNVYVIAFRTAWTPLGIEYIKTGDYTARSATVFRQLVYSMVFLVIVFMMIAHLGFTRLPNGMQFFAGNYSEGIPLIPILLTAYVFSGLVSYFSIYPYTQQKGSYFLKMDLVGIVINVGLNFLLIPKIGLFGAALATLFAYLGVLLYISSVSLKHVKENINTEKMLEPFAVFVISIVIFYTVQNSFVLAGSYLALIVLLWKIGHFKLKDLMPWKKSSESI